jgi:hypothetical protein
MDNASNVDDDPFEATEEADSGEEDAEASYALIKALRDIDCKVCYFLFIVDMIN